MSQNMIFVGRIMLGIVPLIIILDLKKFFFRSNRLTKLQSAYAILMMTYGIGMGLKLAMIGPAFIRFHLADLGFPLVLALFTFYTAGHGYLSGNVEPYVFRVEKTLDHTRVERYCLLAAVLICYCYEALTGILHAYAGSDIGAVGSFDWIDMAAYTIGGIAGWTLLIMQEKILHLELISKRKAKLDYERMVTQAVRQDRKINRKINRKSRRY